MSVIAPPTISVIIPALNEQACIGPLLAHLCACDVDQIILVDGGSRDKTCEIARAFSRVQIAHSAAGRGQQIAAGARHAIGDIIWIIHADSVLPEGAERSVRTGLVDQSVAMGCFPVRFDRDHLLLSLYGRLSYIESPVSTFGDQGFFMRRLDYLRVGGGPNWSLFEDVELRRRLRRSGRIIKADRVITTSSRRFFRFGLIRTQMINLMLLVRFFLGADPERLAQIYYGARAPSIPSAPRQALHRQTRKIG